MTRLSDDAINSILKKSGHATEQERTALDVSLVEVEKLGDKESMREIFTNIAKYNRMINERITFVNDALTAAIPFTRENLYLICAYSGNGKSTIAANVSYPLWKQGKKTLIISTEEPTQDILFRIACLELGFNFNDYKKGHMPLEQKKEAIKLFPEISQYVKVLDVNYKNGLTMKLEGVKNALTAVQNSDYSCVLIDYYQLIRYSVEKPDASVYEVLNDLRIWLGRYIKNSNVPIVIFAQLHSIGKRNNKDLDSRVKSGPEILETATVVLECIPNFETQTTDFLIVKDRFGLSGHRVICAFDKGKFVELTEEHKQRVLNKRLNALVSTSTPERKPA